MEELIHLHYQRQWCSAHTQHRPISPFFPPSSLLEHRNPPGNTWSSHLALLRSHFASNTHTPSSSPLVQKQKTNKKKPWATITHRQLCHSFVFQLSDNWKNKKTKNHLISSITGKLALKQVNLEVICTYQCLVNFQFFAQLEKHAINILRFSVLMFVPSAFRQIPNQYWWCS